MIGIVRSEPCDKSSRITATYGNPIRLSVVFLLNFFILHVNEVSDIEDSLSGGEGLQACSRPVIERLRLSVESVLYRD